VNKGEIKLAVARFTDAFHLEVETKVRVLSRHSLESGLVVSFSEPFKLGHDGDRLLVMSELEVRGEFVSLSADGTISGEGASGGGQGQSVEFVSASVGVLEDLDGTGELNRALAVLDGLLLASGGVLKDGSVSASFRTSGNIQTSLDCVSFLVAGELARDELTLVTVNDLAWKGGRLFSTRLKSCKLRYMMIGLPSSEAFFQGEVREILMFASGLFCASAISETRRSFLELGVSRISSKVRLLGAANIHFFHHKTLFPKELKCRMSYLGWNQSS